MWFKRNLVSRYTGYMVYGTPGFKVLQDIWFMEHLVSRCYRIYGLRETWFQGVTGYMVYGTPGFKVLQDIRFMGDLVSRYSRMCGFYGTPGFKVYVVYWAPGCKKNFIPKVAFFSLKNMFSKLFLGNV